MSTRLDNNRENRKVNRKKIFIRLGALTAFLAIAISGVLYYLKISEAGVTSKPDVLIWDYKGSANTSYSAINTALGANYNITRVTTTPTVAQANYYDAVIFTTGNYDFATQLTAAEKDFLDQYLNQAGNRGHLIIEGEQLLTDHTAVSQVFSNILKVRTNGWSAGNTATSYRITNNTHPVTYNLTLTSYTATGTGTFRAFNPVGTQLIRWNRSTSPNNTVLSVYEGTSRKRLVFLGFKFTTWTGTTATRDNVIRYAVKWVSDFAEAQLVSGQIPTTNVNPGDTNVKVAHLKYSSYANARNDNKNTITSFAVYHTGTVPASQITGVKLYASDASGNLGTQVGSTVLQNGKATFNVNLSAGTGDNYYVITYDLGSSIDEDMTLKTLKVRLADASEFHTLEGGVVKIYGATETAARNVNNVNPPTVPTQVYAENQITVNRLKVGWKANSEPDLVGYMVYRAVDSTGGGPGAYSLLGYAGSNEYVDTGLTEFYRYYYKITAYDVVYNNSSYSTAVYGVYNRRPATPAGLNVTNPATGHQLNLSWDALVGEPADPLNNNNPDLAGYNLYAATVLDAAYTKVNSTVITDTSYSHTGLRDGLSYSYKIAAVDRYGLESTMSSPVSGIPTDTSPPAIVSRYPTEGQDYVERNVYVQVKFDDLLDTGSGISGWILLERKNMDGSYSGISGAISYNPATYELVYTPDANLSAVGTYRVTVKGGAGGVKSASSNLNLAADQQWTFGTLLNPHTDFQNNSTLCGYCHSAHSASGQDIIRAPKILDLCFMCHDGTGSAYDVKAGKYYNGERAVPLAAGGYDLALGSTSTHFTDLANAVYGSAGLFMTIDCNTCHEPHGTSNFRNLRTTINDQPVSVQGTVYGPAYSQNTTSGYEITTYSGGWEEFCGTCHSEYQIYHSVTTNSGEENWRHRTGVSLTGGSSGGRWTVSYPGSGLYTTLPTIGAPSGAFINNYTILTGGSLATGTYNYIVTAQNAVGESVYGNILQVQNTTPNAKIKITWERITNAFKYRVYRYVGTGDPTALDVTLFQLVAEVPDYPVEYTDEGIATQAYSPPLVSNARIACITCHFPHGTTAVADNGDPTRLRRYDNDGVCEDCHKK